MKRQLTTDNDVSSFITLKYKRTHVDSYDELVTTQPLSARSTSNDQDISTGTYNITSAATVRLRPISNLSEINENLKDTSQAQMTAEAEIHKVLGPVQSSLQDLFHTLVEKERLHSSNISKSSKLEFGQQVSDPTLIKSENQLDDQPSLSSHMKTVNHLQSTQLDTRYNTNSDTRQQCDHLEIKSIEAEAKVKQLNNEILALQSSNISLSRISEHLSKQLEEAQNEIKTTREHAESLGEISKCLIDEKLEVAKQSNIFKADLDICRTELDNKNNLVEQLQHQVQTFENRLNQKDDNDIAELNQLRNERNEFQHRMILMEEQLYDRDKKIYDLEWKTQGEATTGYITRQKNDRDHQNDKADGKEHNVSPQKVKTPVNDLEREWDSQPGNHKPKMPPMSSSTTASTQSYYQPQQ